MLLWQRRDAQVHYSDLRLLSPLLSVGKRNTLSFLLSSFTTFLSYCKRKPRQYSEICSIYNDNQNKAFQELFCIPCTQLHFLHISFIKSKPYITVLHKVFLHQFNFFLVTSYNGDCQSVWLLDNWGSVPDRGRDISRRYIRIDAGIHNHATPTIGIDILFWAVKRPDPETGDSTPVIAEAKYAYRYISTPTCITISPCRGSEQGIRKNLLDWSAYTCLTQLYAGRDMYIIYYIKNNYMFRYFLFAIFRLINKKTW